jgi:hypothetical protein
MGFSWSPDGALVAIVQSSGTIDFWDAKTGATRKVFKTAPSGFSSAVKWSPDGAEIAAIRGRMLEIWSVKSARLRASLDVGDPPPHDLAWSPESLRIAYWTPGAIAGVWFWTVKGDIRPVDLQPCVDVAFVRDGSWVKCRVEAEVPVELLDVRTGVRLRRDEASKLLAVFGETFVQAPPNAPRLVRISDLKAIGFHRVRVGGRLVPVAVTDEGLFVGEREAAAQVVVSERPDKSLVPLATARLEVREQPKLLSDFIADKPLPFIDLPEERPPSPDRFSP